MREIKVEKDDTLETAYKKLVSSAGRQVAFIRYKGVMVLSSASLEDAYRTVYGCSKKDYELRQKQVKMIPSEDEEEKVSVFDDKPSDVIRDLRTSILIGAKDPETGLYRSEIAKNYIRKMSRFAKYCKEEVKEEWKQSIVYYVYSVGRETENGELEFTDNQLEDYLDFYEKLGNVMKLINEEKSWSEVEDLVKSYSLSQDDTKSLIECMLYYSPSGEEFVTNVFGKGPLTYKND